MMDGREAIKGLVAKLVRVMAAAGRPAMSGQHGHHQYRYVTEADVIEAVRGALVEEGVWVGSSVVSSEVRCVGRDAKGDVLVTMARVRLTFYDGDTGAAVSVDSEGESANVSGQAVISAVTGAVKTGLQKAFLLPRLEDADGDGPARMASRGVDARTGEVARITAGQRKYLERLMVAAGVEAGAVCERASVAELGEMTVVAFDEDVVPWLKGLRDGGKR